MKLPSAAGTLKVFKMFAIAEAISWGALLIGMFLKWVLKSTELGVQIAGPIHGALFIGYAVTALLLWKLQRWPFRVALAAGFSAVLPFATLAFERWAGTRGWLTSSLDETHTPERAAVAEAASRETRTQEDVGARIKGV